MPDFFLFVLVSGLALTHPQTAQPVGQAYLKQTGIERAVNDWAARNTSSELRAQAGNLVWISKTIAERKVIIQWDF